MKQEEIIKILANKGYTERQAQVIGSDLAEISPKLELALQMWISKDIETDYIIDEFSIKGLMQKYNMKYPAALLSINWIIKEPEIAKAAIKRGIR